MIFLGRGKTKQKIFQGYEKHKRLKNGGCHGDCSFLLFMKYEIIQSFADFSEQIFRIFPISPALGPFLKRLQTSKRLMYNGWKASFSMNINSYLQAIA